MENLNLNYLEDVITYSVVCGRDREIICPAVIDYISEKTILSKENLLVLNLVKNHYLAHQTLPNTAEIKCYLTTDTTVKLFKDFHAKAKTLKGNRFEREPLLKNTEEFFRQRLLTHTMTEAYAQSMAEGSHIDINGIYSEIEEIMSIHLQDDLGLSIFRDPEIYVNELTNEEAKLSTGYPWLDRQLDGGFLASGSALYNFCAASNVGKSNFIKSLACNLSKQGKHSLIISLEMPRQIYANRFVADLADMNISGLKDNADDVLEFLSSGLDNGFGEIVIKDYATGSITPQMLNSFIKRIQKQYDIKFDAIFVDYPELFKKPTNFGARYDLAVAELYIQTRALSFYHQVPFICVAQLNRDGFKDGLVPKMENIGNAIGIAACSDFMGFLYSSDEMKAINQIGLSVGKSRFGPVNKSKLFDVNEFTLKITESSYQELVDISDQTDDDDDDKFLNDLLNAK